MKGYVILISVVAALGGLLFGFDTAVVSGTINFNQPYFGLSEAGLGWTVSSLLFGCIAGVFLAGKAGGHYGRKKVLMAAALLFFISAVGSASAHSLVLFVTARVLGGIAVGVASILSPMYIAELAPAKYRLTLVSLNQLAIVIGILVAFFSNYLLLNTGENNWRWMLLVMAAPAILLFFSLFLVRLEKLSGGITFLIFALICLTNLLYVLKYVPETKGKTLEELEKEFAK